MSLKCVLVNPVQLVCPPFGLLSIGAVLESRGWDVTVRELPSRLTINYQEHIKALIEYLKKKEPDLIGITCMAAQRSEVMSIIREIKKASLSGMVVVGGVHASFVPHEVMGWGADYVVIYEGEDTIVELLDILRGKRPASSVKGLYYREAGSVNFTGMRGPVEDLSKLPLPAYHLVDRSRFTTRRSEIRGRWSRSGWVMTSRGCPSICTFCSAHRMFGKRVRYRNMNHVFKEIDLLVKDYGIETLVLIDDTFTVNRGFVFEFCRRIKKEYPRMLWDCQARVNFFDEEYARVLKESNCIQIDFGVESGSQKVLDRLKKGIKIEETVKAFDVCRKYGLRTVATIMVGNPGETMEDLEKTGALLKRIRPDFYAAYYATPFPGTDLYEEAKKDNLIDGGERYWHQDAAPISLSGVDVKILKKYVRRFTRLNLFKNYLCNPVFIYDMICFSMLNPVLALQIIANLSAGNSKKALSLITNSVYYTKQRKAAA